MGKGASYLEKIFEGAGQVEIDLVFSDLKFSSPTRPKIWMGQARPNLI